MRAAIYNQFGGEISVRDVPDPTPAEQDVVIRVMANGICRSDWHGWMGHDPSISLPHVPGHECAGVVEAVGKNVMTLRPGDRVVVPFSGGCGRCSQCRAGRQHICDNDFQPGFSAWGAFAQFCRIGYADANLVKLPDEIGFVEAASLGCRCMTSFGAIVDRAMVRAGEFVAVFGCGGVGLSAIMIANAIGASVIAVDRRPEALEQARRAGARQLLLADGKIRIAEAIVDLSSGGAHVSVDAIGDAAVVAECIQCLRKRGRHIQIGLLNPESENALVPMNRVVGKELVLTGSHGLPASRFPELLEMVLRKQIDPGALVTGTVSLIEAAGILMNMDDQPPSGIIVIDRFHE
jgi:alcohol dehydrogenase